MKKTINVPLDELQPGDVVTIPPLVVTGWQCGVAQFNRFGAVTERLEAWSATATREVEEPEYPLTWADALNQMVTRGKVCASEHAPRSRYRFNGRFEFKRAADDEWSPWGTPSILNADSKWRIVGESE